MIVDGTAMNKEKNNHQKQLMVLFVGLGGAGQRHIRNLIRIRPRAKIFAIRKRGKENVLDDSLNEVKGIQLKKKYNIEYLESVAEASTKGINIIFICNPTSMHCEYICEGMKYGMHIFVEKPISYDADSMNSVLAKLKNYNRVTMVGFQNRFHPCIIRTMEIIERELVGRVFLVNAEVGDDVRCWHQYEDYRELYACRADLGGGVVLTQIHELDYLFLMFGMPDCLFATGGTLADLDIDVEDVVNISMQYNEDGGICKVVNVCEDFVQRPPSRKCKICGTKGRVEIDLIKNKLIRYGMDGEVIEQQQFAFDRNKLFIDEISVFIDCIENDIATNIPIQEGLYSLALADAVKESLATGIPVKPKYNQFFIK